MSPRHAPAVSRPCPAREGDGGCLVRGSTGGHFHIPSIEQGVTQRFKEKPTHGEAGRNRSTLHRQGWLRHLSVAHLPL